MRLLRSWEKARGLGLRGCVLGCTGEGWRFPLYTRGSLVGVAMKGLSLKPADFAKAIMFWKSHLSVVDGKSPSLIVFCAPLTSGSLGRGGGGAWAVAEGKRIEANFLHGSHQWTKRLSFC